MTKTHTDTIATLISGLSYQDKERILGNLIWDLFGDVEEDGEAIINPVRNPDKTDIASIAESLRNELWPEPSA